jgi:hypothetical protein
MRIACCLALATFLIPAAQANAQEERALVLVMPHDELLFSDVSSLAEAGFHVAVASPAVDAEASGQTFLDISQGARVSERAYDEELPRFRLGADGRFGPGVNVGSA